MQAPQHSETPTVRREGQWGRDRTRALRRTLSVILLLNLIVALAKLGYGIASNSLAMSADGVNSLMDAAANLFALFAIALAARPPDPNHLYGHRRFETLTSLVIAIFMILALEEILQNAWHHWRTGDRPTVTLISFAVMLTTLAVNVGVTLWERRAARRLHSSILLADSRHTQSDVFVTLSVIAGLVATHFGYPTADLVIALLVAAVIAWGAWEIIHEAAMTLSDVAAVPTLDIAQAARSVAGVRGVHNIRSRGGEGMVWVDMHIQVDPNLRVGRAHEIASEVAARVEQQIGEPADVTVHVEPAEPEHLGPMRGYHPGE